MLLRIYEENPEGRKISQVSQALEQDGIIVYPTDGVYAFGCSVDSEKAMDRLCTLRGVTPKEAMMTLVCRDISQVSEYTVQLDNKVFRILKRHLPGPFTFILPAGQKAKAFKNRKKTVGIRIPENKIALDLIEQTGKPLLSMSLKGDDQVTEYLTDPQDMLDLYGKQVDIIIDGGIGRNTPSTVVDLTGDSPEIIREGAGIFQL
jgi:tRNA threonylcarbamoyl adenosine modification protein (Sua5/YciO/YrdC/YwlC family)